MFCKIGSSLNTFCFTLSNLTVVEISFYKFLQIILIQQIARWNRVRINFKQGSGNNSEDLRPRALIQVYIWWGQTLRNVYKILYLENFFLNLNTILLGPTLLNWSVFYWMSERTERQVKVDETSFCLGVCDVGSNRTVNRVKRIFHLWV